MGTPVSLAMFAALVAAITVVAAMTVIGALALLYYSAADQSDPADDVTHLHLPRDPQMSELLPAVAPVAPSDSVAAPFSPDGPTRIDTPPMMERLPALDDEQSSLNRDLGPLPPPNRATWAEPAWLHGSGTRPAVGGPSRFNRGPLGPRPQNAAFGSPEWTEEEGATEIFSAHNLGDMSEFAFVDEEPASRR